MELFEQMQTMGHEQVHVCSNPAIGLQAIIAVHSTVLGPGLGGVRMWPYQSSEEALTDVLRLSRGMTYKAAATGVNLGGAKAVIIGDAKTEKTEELLRGFARFVNSLGGIYITAEDVGMRIEDMEIILGETRWVTGVSTEHGGSGNPSPVTAYGVLQGIKASARWKYGDDSLEGRTVAVQGLGSVGRYLSGYLIDEGAKVFGCDVDEDATLKARELGVEIVDTDSIYEVDCDIFAPCALGATINAQTIPKLRCQIVAGAANNQLADEDRDGEALTERDILYAPDYVINAGGLINVYTELNGYDRERAMKGTRQIYNTLVTVFERAQEDKVTTQEAADRQAEARIDRISKLGTRQWSRFTGHRNVDF